MNTSIAQIARNNRIIALDTMRRRNQTLNASADVLCLRSMREKMKVKPVFQSTRPYQLQQRLAA